MEFCLTVDMIKDYFTKALQGSQFCCFQNIILGIYEYEIPFNNGSEREFLEERKIKLDRENEEDQKSAKFACN